MELDLFDGNYKPSNKVINSDDYVLGDLVIFSDSEKPNGRYYVKCHYKEDIVYDSLIRVGRYKRGYYFELIFSESNLEASSPIYFYGKRIKNIQSQFNYSWVLQESQHGSVTLDSLEMYCGYNMLGETEFSSD